MRQLQGGSGSGHQRAVRQLKQTEPISSACTVRIQLRFNVSHYTTPCVTHAYATAKPASDSMLTGVDTGCSILPCFWQQSNDNDVGLSAVQDFRIEGQTTH